MKTGLGIRPELFTAVAEQKPELGFLEAHSENYFQPSVARARLLELRADYPISLHGVGLSLGRADALDEKHLRELRALVNDVDPFLVSEHLAWSAYSHRHLPDLLPLPLTEEAFQTICAHITQMQDALQRQILLENPSNYLAFDLLQVSEPEFLNAVARQTGCGLLLDINNIHVSASNLGRNADEFLQSVETQHIQQYHLAGYLEMQVGSESLLIDTHNQTVYPPVWDLFRRTLALHGKRPTLFEWDSDFPELSVMLSECQKADAEQASLITDAEQSHADEATGIRWPQAEKATSLAATQSQFLDDVLSQAPSSAAPIKPHQPRIYVYQNNTFGATLDYLSAVFPATKGLVGDPFFRQMCNFYVGGRPPAEGNIYHYGVDFKIIVDQLDGLSDMPYLADVIDFEWALHAAYFADPGERLNPAKFEQNELLQIPIRLNDSVWMHRSKFPVFEIHRQSLPDYTGEVSIDLGQSQDTLLVCKRGYAVHWQTIDSDTLLFLQQLGQQNGNGQNLLQVIEGLSGSLTQESLSATLATVFELDLLALDDSHAYLVTS